MEQPGGGRIAERRPPREEDLVEVAAFGRDCVPLHRLAAAALAAMVEVARSDGFGEPLLVPVSGYRSATEQAWLWTGALEKYGDPELAAQWVARPGTSAHQSGRAVDLHLGHPIESEYVETMRRSAVWRWLVTHAERFGFYPYDTEPWHWEYNPPHEVSGSAGE